MCVYSIIFHRGTWTQVGQVINGTASLNQSGRSVSLSSDGKILAIGEPGYASGGNSGIGSTRIFENISGTWTQIGSRIIGQASSDSSGRSISLSSDGTIIAIGVPGKDVNGQDSGHVRIFRNTSNIWTQVGINIEGEEANDFFGGSVSLSGNGNTLVVGATTFLKKLSLIN